jgi:beta-glucosidase
MENVAGRVSLQAVKAWSYHLHERNYLMPSRFSRRTFGQLAGSLGAAAALPFQMFAAPPAPAQRATAANDRRFPADFLWGSATASYQVEGAVAEDGRGKTIWDTFSHTAGKTHNGDTGDVATDSYHRYAEDIALMKELGLETCRFSVAWSRIFPDGAGQPNQKGIDHYRAFCQALRAAGIEPWCTLYHWDLPQALEDKGGWQNRDTAKIFADYAGYTAGKLAGVCSHFMTMNEISTFVDLGYGNGIHAPGLKLNRAKLAQVRHHAVLGHGLAVQAIRAAAPHVKVGAAENLQAIVPVFDSPEHVAAAKKAIIEENAGYLTRNAYGQVHRPLPADAGPRCSEVYAGGDEGDRIAAGLPGTEHLHGDLRARRGQCEGVRHSRQPGELSAHGEPVADHRPGRAVLGAPAGE